MAKKAAKETSMPLVFALVFFVLSTIAFGVMWYMQYSDQEAKAAAVKSSDDKVRAATGELKKAQMLTKLYRIYVGVDEADDKDVLKAEHKAGDELSTEMKRINDTMAKKLGVEDATKLPTEVQIWTVDDKGKLSDAPDKGIVSVIGKAVSEREAAIANEGKTSALYSKAVTDYRDAAKVLADLKNDFVKVADALPKDFKTKLDAEVKKYDDRKKAFIETEAASRKDIDAALDANGKLEREKKRMAQDIDRLQEQVAGLATKVARSNDTFQYDEPQGKILRRPEAGIVEINIGSNALVRPGLTFTVLPHDFPEKGRQSRIRVMRIPDERGVYKNVERFVEKATIEVIEVVGPNLSRARVTQEYDPIRDGAAVGDLLYNSVWRKGQADHIALIGIFDVNGDGSDDIESVVRDLTRMGIPVDAYFDMKQRKWVGQITEQTRFVVEGWYPASSGIDPNRDQKTKLLGEMAAAIKVARDKGVPTVGFRDFFPRMGYRVKIDLPADKLNQATAPYLDRVAAVEMPPNP